MRCLEVSNPRRLEYTLDKIWIGEMKMYANLPRFKRDVGKKVNVETKEGKKGSSVGDSLTRIGTTNIKTTNHK